MKTRWLVRVNGVEWRVFTNQEYLRDWVNHTDLEVQEIVEVTVTKEKWLDLADFVD